MALAGLVLHSSRCGSTLVLRALGAWPGVVAVDEPPELDDALTTARRGGDPTLVRAVLEEVGGRGTRVIVKTDAWHVLELPRLLAAAPGVPWIFVHRDPLEILVSHARQPGSHTVPGLLDDCWFGPPRTSFPLPHAADVLAAIFAAAARRADAATLVDYAELPDAVVARVAAQLGCDPDAVDAARLAAVLARHAKRPYEPWVADSVAKQAAVTPAIAELVATRVAPAYAELLRAGRVAA